MSQPIPQRQNLFLKSFLLALFLHIFFFSAFVFTFPKRFEGYKPQLISLGSILDQHDVVSVPGHSPGSSAETKGPAGNGIEKFVYEFFEMAQNPSRETDVSKPIFGEKILSQEKMSVKPMFGQGQAQAEIPDEPVVDYGISPYRPLRFSPYD